MRGARAEFNPMGMTAGIIPADAGSTSIPALVTKARKDHPRGCGEHVTPLLSVSVRSGSSPRMRGAPSVRCRCSRRSGIIPADAGSTTPQTRVEDFNKDHPRGCGEHAVIEENTLFMPGSSPRMRGALGSLMIA